MGVRVGGKCLHREMPRSVGWAFMLLRCASPFLAVTAGFRSIAIESSWQRDRCVDAVIQGGREDLDEVMRQGFSHGFGDSGQP